MEKRRKFEKKIIEFVYFSLPRDSAHEPVTKQTNMTSVLISLILLVPAGNYYLLIN